MIIANNILHKELVITIHQDKISYKIRHFQAESHCLVQIQWLIREAHSRGSNKQNDLFVSPWILPSRGADSFNSPPAPTL